MQTINLPFGQKKYACGICGHAYESLEQALECEETGVSEFSLSEIMELTIGGEVNLLWGADKIEKATISRIFYSGPGMKYNWWFPPPYQELAPHTLMVEIIQKFYDSEEARLPLILTYDDFKLWRDGEFFHTYVDEGQ